MNRELRKGITSHAPDHVLTNIVEETVEAIWGPGVFQKPLVQGAIIGIAGSARDHLVGFLTQIAAHDFLSSVAHQIPLLSLHCTVRRDRRIVTVDSLGIHFYRGACRIAWTPESWFKLAVNTMGQLLYEQAKRVTHDHYKWIQSYRGNLATRFRNRPAEEAGFLSVLHFLNVKTELEELNQSERKRLRLVLETWSGASRPGVLPVCTRI